MSRPAHLSLLWLVLPYFLQSSEAAILDIEAPVGFVRSQELLSETRNIRGTAQYLPRGHQLNQTGERALLVVVELPFLAEPSTFEKVIGPKVPRSSSEEKRKLASVSGMSVRGNGNGHVSFAVDFVNLTSVAVPKVTVSDDALVGAAAGTALAGPAGAVLGAAAGAVLGKKKGKKTDLTLDTTYTAKGSVRFALDLSPKPINAKDVAVQLTYVIEKDCKGFGKYVVSCEREIDSAIRKANLPTCEAILLPLPDSSFLLKRSTFGLRNGTPTLELIYEMPGWRGVVAPFMLALKGVPEHRELPNKSVLNERDPCSRAG